MNILVALPIRNSAPAGTGRPVAHVADAGPPTPAPVASGHPHLGAGHGLVGQAGDARRQRLVVGWR